MKVYIDCIKDLRSLLEDHGAGSEALHEEYSDHDGGDGVTGDAENQSGDPGSTQACIIGGASVNDAFDMTCAVLLRFFRESFRNRVGDPGPDVSARARKDAHRGAHKPGADDIQLVFAQSPADAGEHLFHDHRALLAGQITG